MLKGPNGQKRPADVIGSALGAAVVAEQRAKKVRKSWNVASELKPYVAIGVAAKER